MILALFFSGRHGSKITVLLPCLPSQICQQKTPYVYRTIKKESSWASSGKKGKIGRKGAEKGKIGQNGAAREE